MFETLVKANNIAAKNKNEAQLMLKHKAKVQAAEDKIMSNFEYIGEGYFQSKDPNDYLFYTESDLGNLLDSEAIEKFCPHQELWKRKLFFLELENKFKQPESFDLDADQENILGTLILCCNIAKRCGNFKIANIIWSVVAYHSFGMCGCDWYHDYDDYQEFCDDYAVARIVYNGSEATIPIPLLKDPDSFKAKCNKKRPRPFSYNDGLDGSLKETDKQFRLKSILLNLNSTEPDFMAIAYAYLKGM
ncbi:MAG: hypothetical protein WBA93_32520 [Microcoleaceae cyanobacterium]